MAADTGKEQGTSDRNVIGRMYFWASNISTGDSVQVTYVVLHNSEWFTSGSMIQAITLHTLTGDGLPSRTNLLTPIYCNSDAPLRSQNDSVCQGRA